MGCQKALFGVVQVRFQKKISSSIYCTFGIREKQKTLVPRREV